MYSIDADSFPPSNIFTICNLKGCAPSQSGKLVHVKILSYAQFFPLSSHRFQISALKVTHFCVWKCLATVVIILLIFFWNYFQNTCVSNYQQHIWCFFNLLYIYSLSDTRTHTKSLSHTWMYTHTEWMNVHTHTFSYTVTHA